MALGNIQASQPGKDSGIDWLGEIPGHWQIKPGLVALLENKRDNKGMKETQVLSLSYGNIVVKPEEKLTGLVPESFETYQIVEPGDIIIRGTDLQNDQTSLRTGLARDRGIITSAYIGLRVKSGFNPAFVHYYLHALDTRKILYKFGSGLRQNLGFEDFKRLPIVEIPASEQDAIVRFLDEKTAKIDDAIALEERQIALLKERKQIVIQKAVTKGLNPNVPMKDSGVDWIDEIPVHWRVQRAKYLFREMNERSHSGAEELLSVSHMTGVTPRSEKNISMFMAEDYSGSKLCEPGDLIYNIMWAWMGALGVSDHRGIVSPSYAIYRPFDQEAFNKKYLEWLMRSNSYVEHYNKVSTGLHSSRLRFYSHMFFDMFLGYPAREEQDDIVAYIEGEVEKIDAAIRAKVDSARLMAEYKATLINSAVTGKIKVT
ncbi:restriction endonuclease subunit S [Blastomonas fulva]|jgi:type I restriction enzyme S subunit|uniref:restriction endonuclease subunit S n=1 Tax=Blastomonas fulva TaxID=1550728 RepID=UPI003D2AF3FB